MAKATEEDLIYFSNIDDLNDRGYICIGVLFEIRNISIVGIHDEGLPYYIPIKIKSDPKIVGRTFATVNNVKAWTEDIDFSYLNQEYEYNEKTGITTMKLVDEYPNPWRTILTDKYIKTEYDKSGQIISGTNYVGYTGGNSIYITGATQGINVETIDQDSLDKKINYDLGKTKIMYYIK